MAKTLEFDNEDNSGETEIQPLQECSMREPCSVKLAFRISLPSDFRYKKSGFFNRFETAGSDTRDGKPKNKRQQLQSTTGNSSPTVANPESKDKRVIRQSANTAGGSSEWMVI